VIFSEGDVARLAREAGPALCEKENANIEFVGRLGGHGSKRYNAAVYERGAGLTQACGTGACAIAAAAVQLGEAAPGEEIEVELPGGSLFLRVADDGTVSMRGPAELVFTGELPES
jgi:diaminopimelate epimerase